MGLPGRSVRGHQLASTYARFPGRAHVRTEVSGRRLRLEWRDVWRGAFWTAVLFAIGKYLISLYLTRVAPASTYGAAGSLILVLLWVYYSSLILFFGTSLTVVTILRRDGTVTPKKTAARLNVVVQEE